MKSDATRAPTKGNQKGDTMGRVKSAIMLADEGTRVEMSDRALALVGKPIGIVIRLARIRGNYPPGTTLAEFLAIQAGRRAGDCVACGPVCRSFCCGT